MEISNVTLHEFLKDLVNRHCAPKRQPFVKFRKYPLALVAQIAARMPGLAEGYEIAADQAYELIRACDVEGLKRENIVKESKISREEVAELGAYIDFDKAVKWITGISRPDRSTDAFLRLVKEIVRTDRKASVAFYVSSLRHFYPAEISAEKKAKLFDWIAGDLDEDAIAPEIINAFGKRMRKREVFNLRLLFLRFHSDGRLDERKRRDALGAGAGKNETFSLPHFLGRDGDNSLTKVAKKLRGSVKKAKKADSI